MDRSRVAIVIPAYNEGKTIRRIVEGVLPHGVPLVVDDASDDGTGDLARKAGALVVRNARNCGYDGALSAGFDAASKQDFDYVITLDADGQHDPSILGRYVELLGGPVDLIVGIRPTRARFGERVFGWATNFFYGIKDPLCGMKGYRMSLFRDAGCFDTYESIGTQLMMFALKKKGYKIVQTEIPIGKRECGSPRFGRIFTTNWKILRALVLGLAS